MFQFTPEKQSDTRIYKQFFSYANKLSIKFLGTVNFKLKKLEIDLILKESSTTMTLLINDKANLLYLSTPIHFMRIISALYAYIVF